MLERIANRRQAAGEGDVLRAAVSPVVETDARHIFQRQALVRPPSSSLLLLVMNSQEAKQPAPTTIRAFWR